LAPYRGFSSPPSKRVDSLILEIDSEKNLKLTIQRSK